MTEAAKNEHRGGHLDYEIYDVYIKVEMPLNLFSDSNLKFCF